jgi:hypothetical protein
MATLVSFTPLPPVTGVTDPNLANLLTAITQNYNQQMMQILQAINNTLSAGGLAAARPGSGTFAGQQYYASDTNVLYIWNGSAWESH